MAKTQESPATQEVPTTIPQSATTSGSEKHQQAHQISKKYAAIAGAVGLVPFPLLDMAAIAGLQVKTVHEIAKLHGRELSDNAGKTAVTASVAALSTGAASSIGASLLRIVPVFGPMAANFAFPGYAAASTYAIGMLFHRHFSEGGTILDFNAKKVKQAYKGMIDGYKSSETTATA